MIKVFITTALVCLVTCSCMSDKEYQLRKQDMTNKANYPATYQPVHIKGPLQLDKDSEIIVTVPSQPYTPTAIPDGQAIQASLVKDVATIGAVTAGAVYSIHKAQGRTTNHTTINNTGATTP